MKYLSVLVCEECSEEVSRVGEDALCYCENCGTFEAPVREIPLEEYEATV